MLAAVAAGWFLLPVPSHAEDPYQYQILYTGRTLGYARSPNEQTIPKTSDGQDSEVAKEFEDQFNNADSAGLPQLRIAMGDNFAPDLYGRSIRVTKSVPACDGSGGTYPSSIHLPKDYFTFKGGWHIWCDLLNPLSSQTFYDNVADFFIKAGYDAMVPGKHDFYFGPTYLRQIASYLEDPCRDREPGCNPDDPRKHAVHMLAENLVITSSVSPSPLNSYPRIPERLADPCHYDTGTNHPCYSSDFGPASLDLPDSVLPWKRQFLFKNARVAVIRGTELFRSDELGNFKDIAVTYKNVFLPDSVEICTESGPVTRGDPRQAVPGDCDSIGAGEGWHFHWPIA